MLTIGQSITLPIAMKVAGVAETVTVRTSPRVIESTRTSAATTLDERTVETLPILGRKFEDLLTLTPGVSIVQGPDGDEITFAGQRGIFNNISLDGGDYNNGFFGEQAGGQRAAIDITLDAVKEFQVIATGAPAEFGRTAGGVVNVITKSGTNTPHGSLFYFQRLESLTGELSDGTNLDGFHREQFGGTFGGPIKTDKAFFFGAVEGITGDFSRPNLGRQLGDTACPVANPTVPQNEALINGNADCQRTALLSFFNTRLGMDESLPIEHPVQTVAVLGKFDINASPSNSLSASWNFNHSRKENETFDVATYGPSANGIEGDPARINVGNLNWFTTLSDRVLNEAHFTYSREKRPRTAAASNLAADTGMGFSPTFRFGNPFFLQPAVDELIWRTQIKDNLTIVRGAHTIKAGGEWMHTLNDQVFRGFFTGRYIFDSVTGFLRYAAPAASGGFGPRTVGCPNGVYVTAPDPCPNGGTPTNGPLLLYLQGASLTGPAVDATGASKIANEEFGLFAAGPVAAGERPDRQLRPALGRAADARDHRPAIDGVRRVPERSGLSLRRHDSGSVEHAAAARRRGLGHQCGRQGCRARELRRVCGAAEHAVAGRIGDDQRRAATVAVREHGTGERVWRDHPGLAGTAGRTGGSLRDSSRSSAACACSTRTTRTRASMPSTWHTSTS